MIALSALLAVALLAWLLLWSTEPRRTYHDLTPSHRRESLKTASAWVTYMHEGRDGKPFATTPILCRCGSLAAVCQGRTEGCRELEASVHAPALLTSTSRGAIRLEKEALAARLRAEEIEARAKVASRPAVPAVAPVATIAGRKRRGR